MNPNDITLQWTPHMTRQQVWDNLTKLSGMPVETVSSEYLYVIIQLLLDIREEVSKHE